MGCDTGRYTLSQQGRRLWRSVSTPPKALLRHWLDADYITTSFGIKIWTARSDIPESIRMGLFDDKYERTEVLLAQVTLHSRDRVLDIGAGIGLVGLVATGICGEGNVLSCEANPYLEPIIRKNYQLNKWEPNLVMCAVTSDGRDLTFFRQQEDWVASSAFVRGRMGDEIIVQSVMINDLIDRHRPTAIIMDVEGGEVELLPVADLEGVRVVIVEMHPGIVGKELIEQAVEGMKEKGWRIARKRVDTVAFVPQEL